MASPVKTEIMGYGVQAFRSRHLAIRKLKRAHNPSLCGFRIWASSWLLMDFLQKRGLPNAIRVMDLGCGWGLAGIYCAKQHNAMVTSVDADSEVFPYLRMHANMNRVDLVTLNKSFDDLTAQHLEGVDVLIGADICFWDTMVDSLKRLIWRAFHSDVQAVVIADPGRSTFHRLGEHFIKRGMGKILHWTVQRPHPIQGLILRVVPPAH